MAKPKLWMGLSAVGVTFMLLIVAAQQLADLNAGLINDALGLSTQKIGKIDSADIEGSAYKDSDGSLSNDGWKQMIKDSYTFCEEAVEQGSVLMKNTVKNGEPVLPLKSTERKVTLFGQGSKNLFMRSGAGGAAPNDNYVVKLDAAFVNNGFEINRTVWNLYSTIGSRDMTNPNTTVEKDWSSSLYNDSVKATFAEYNDAAIVTLVRIGTEDSDPPRGKLDLNSNESNMLKMIKDSGAFQKIIVLINSPMPMSVDWANDPQYGIDSVVFMGSPGYYGAGGIVHVLMGQKTVVDDEGNETVKVVNASGHAPDTFAASASSSPAYINWGNSSSIAVYKEGVYVGYKYYETRYEDLILGQGNANSNQGIVKSTGSSWNYAEEMGYPFGYGLSYTNFTQKLTSLKYDGKKEDTITAKVEVKNEGTMDGKASVQLYAAAPYTDFDKEAKLGKSAIALMAYEKVDVPAGETKEVEIKFDRYFLCTYDYVVNKTYILEGGDYYFAIGNGAHEALNNVLAVRNNATNLYDHNGDAYTGNADCVKKLTFETDPTTYRKSHYSDENVTNQFDDADYNYMAQKNNKSTITYLDRSHWDTTYPTTETSNPASNDDGNMQQYYQQDPDGEKYSEGDGSVYNVEYKLNGKPYVITFNDMANIPLTGKITRGKFAGKKGEDIWDAFIAQMTLDDLIISVSDNRGILDVKKVGKKGNSVAEGPEGLLSRYQYGDKRWATGFPTGPVYTGTWDHAMQAKFGAFYGEDALFCGVAAVNAPGANINRTPYTSRASEYMSEDGILNYNVAANIIGAARKKGLVMNIKHCFLNNQESGRKGIYTYCNEQAIREIYLKPFEGALTKGCGLGIMTSYNRIGARYAACHEPLMQNVMRGEWAYEGLIIDDAYTGSNTDRYSFGPAMLHCGTDLFCLDGGRGGQLKQWITSNDDGDLLLDLQRANKYVMYAISRSWMGAVNVSDADFAAPWWKKTLTGLEIGAIVIAAGLVGAYIFFEVANVLGKKEKPEPASGEPKEQGRRN